MDHLSVTGTVLAYIGPGAGFAAVGSFLVLFAAMVSAILTLMTWPLRYTWRAVRGRRAYARSRIQRFVILGLDGLDPDLAEEFMDAGRMPNLAGLRQSGCFKRLGTTLPPLSPVAWSSFLTACNPGKHNIYDFLACDRHTYLPKLSSVSIRGTERSLRLGGYQIPIGKPDIRLLRKSRPFWHDLGQAGIVSSILRVPITFPPEKLHGVLLSAMCTPDLRGSQGTFSYYSTRSVDPGQHTGGEQFHVRRQGSTIDAFLVGPENPIARDGTALRCPFTVTIDRKRERATLRIDGSKHALNPGVYSEWIPITFRIGPTVRIRGVCQFLLIGLDPEFELYVTPIQIDPEKPALPISYPRVFSTYLAKNQGRFATLGLAEDTWALNAGILNDATFLGQCLQADQERERMFFDALDKTKHGLCVCVFDGTDRIQHMFWRYLDEQHPANTAKPDAPCPDAIEALYERMDALVGRTLERCGSDGTVLMVISDHGFNSFRRGVDLNAWLRENGYLKLQSDGPGGKYLAGVDWSATRAFAIGLAGIYVNTRGREAQGIVDPGVEADQLRKELADRLTRLGDPETGEVAIHRAYVAKDTYRGPYRDQAPDIIVGYGRGYRVSWEAAVGQVTDRVFHDNTKPWSGDHCIDPSLIPGVLFSNVLIEDEHPRLMDIGPTALELFGVPLAKHMDGRPLRVRLPQGWKGQR